MQSIIERERKRIVDRIRSDYLAQVAREKLLSVAVAREKAEVERFNQLSIEHNILKREFETNQQLYQNLLQRLKDATLSAGLRATNIHVVDEAIVPAVPVRPKKLLNIVISLWVGLILGVTFAFLAESLDTSVKSAEDLERLVAAPALAVIPTAGSAGRRRFLGRHPAREKPGTNGKVELTVLEKPTSQLAESYRMLRTSILLSTAPKPPQAILLTSTQPFEGKTCTSINLALALAQRDDRVIMIDADLRRPGLSEILGLTKGKGLSGVLTGAYGLEDAVRRIKSSVGLWVLPSGPHPPNPAELLSSESMEKLIAELRQHFQYLVVDSPPVLMVTDATALSSLVDGVVLVAESGVVHRTALVRAYRVLQNAGGRILGVVLNKMDLRREGYYGSYYGSYYSSYYHSESSKQEEQKAVSPLGGPTRSPSGSG